MPKAGTLKGFSVANFQRARVKADARGPDGEPSPLCGCEGVVIGRSAKYQYRVRFGPLSAEVVALKDLEAIAEFTTESGAQAEALTLFNAPKRRATRRQNALMQARAGYFHPRMGLERRPDFNAPQNPVTVELDPAAASANDQNLPGRNINPWQAALLRRGRGSMLKAPRSLPSFALLMQDMEDMQLNQRSLAKYLGVSRETMGRWKIEGRAPRPAMLALFWESQWGRNLADTSAVNDARRYYGYHEALKKEVARLCAEIETLNAEIAELKKGGAGSANSPVYRQAVS